MPRALEVLDVTLRDIERSEIGAVEAIDALLTEGLPVSRLCFGGHRQASRTASMRRRMARSSSGRHASTALRGLSPSVSIWPTYPAIGAHGSRANASIGPSSS